MDELKTGMAPERAISSSERPLPDSHVVSLNATEIRIDGAHAPQVLEQAVQVPPAPAPASPRGNSQLLLEAGRIVEQMQAQVAELDAREERLQQQLAQLEAERLRFQVTRSQEESQLELRRLKLATEEESFAQRLAESQAMFAQLDADRQAVEEARSEVERSRVSLRDDVLREFQSERQQIESERQEVAAEFARARSLTEALEEQRRTATAAAEQSIQAERERLWQTLIAEWEERRNQFQAEHDAWLSKSQAERLEIERERAFYEAAVRNAEADFAKAREAQAIELQTIRDQQLAALETERAELQERIRTERAEWEQTRDQQQAELLTFRQKHEESIKAENDEREKTRASQLAELHSERAVLENRIRFQQEHLEKLRADLDRAQNEHRRERQIEQQRLEDESRQLLRRMRQIDLYRAAIDEREKSLEREREVLNKSRRAFSSTANLDRLNLQAERNAWVSERQIQQAELLRQQELFASHADSLESRRIRLDRLRTELEDTHRSTLEMRLAVEEAWVGLTQAAGQEESRQRVEQVRNSLVGYYQQLHEGVVEQRREHLEAQTKFERLRAEFHDERRKLMEWIAARDQELRIGEERLRIASSDAVTRDSAWQAERERWMMEKAEAEQVIRKLLGELGHQHRAPLATLELMSETFSSDSTEFDAATTPTRPISQLD